MCWFFFFYDFEIVVFDGSFFNFRLSIEWEVDNFLNVEVENVKI